MEEENFSPRDSLQVIQSMIDKTKAELSENSIYFLLWGWLVFTGCLLQYFLLVIIKTPYHFLAWLVIIPGILFSIFYSIKYKHERRVKTYISDSMSKLWTGMSISFMALCFILTNIGWQHAFPIYILFYATGTFISGGILQFKPLQLGGIICWVLAVASTFVNYQNQILFTAAAILVSYLVPGYLLKKKAYNK
ncbi:MAG: hypothetical protein H7Z13_14940 [Ferruginibacter sp.]|nr:hypothetical protein [Ferruginibacter sp.]